MSLPNEVLLRDLSERAFLVGDDSPELGRVSRELGPQAINAGQIVPIDVRMWVAESTGGQVVLYPADAPAQATVLAAVDASTVSLAFDQSGRPHLAYTLGGSCRLLWFDTLSNAYQTLTLAGASTPVLTMDDKRLFASLANRNDILCFYIGSGGLCYRQQRDRFAVERVAAAGEGGAIVRAGLCADWRLRVETV